MMLKYIYLLSLFLLVQVSYAAEPVNIEQAKRTLRTYHDSGEYHRDIAKIVQQAKKYLKQRLSQAKKTDKLAIVFDIDETLLSSYPFMKQHHFGGSLDLIHDYYRMAKAVPIKETMQLYYFARKNNVAIFLVTGRKNDMKAATIKNLKRAGIHHWDSLFLRPNRTKSTTNYKERARQQIVKKGYNLVLNMGDQQSDLCCNSAEKHFKLPNPFYYVP